MAINLNDSLYGAQFSAFRQLANQAGLAQDTLVSIDEAGRGKGLLNQNGERRTIVLKEDGDQIKSFSNPFFKRSQNQKDLNNEVRNLFKETVLNICGKRTLDDLPKAVLDVMKKGDYDNEGHPLSVRRIRAVTDAILAEASREAKAVAPKMESRIDTIGDGPRNGNLSLNVAPETDNVEVESSVDDEDVSFKYKAPAFIAGLPSETEEAFMEFYCDAVDQSIEDGRTKEECDETLKEMFRAVGYDKNDRKLLAELLANGKPRFLEEDGVLPYKAGAVRFAEKLKDILELTKRYRKELAKPYGNIVADTILATLKTCDRIFDVDDLKPIDDEMCAQFSTVAEEVDISGLLPSSSGKGRSAKSLNRRLDGFERQVAEKFSANFLKMNDSQMMVTIKQNLLMNLALARAVSQNDSLAEEIEEHYDVLVEKYGRHDFLQALSPALEGEQ